MNDEDREHAELAKKVQKQLCIDPIANNAVQAHNYSGHKANGAALDTHDFVMELFKERDKIRDGDLSRIGDTLIAQATALDTMFNSYARLAALNVENLHAFERFSRLALKAQQQTTNTLRVLSEHKQPRSYVLAKQANISSGHQQVNNGVINEELDTRSESETISANQENTALEKIDGAELETGESTILSERPEARSV